MKLYLWWWWNTQEIPTMKETITTILKKEEIRNLLHIPFAGAGIRHRISGRCMPKEFKPFIEEFKIKYFDGQYKEEILEAPYETIYLNWGHYREFLFQNIQKDEVLEKITKANIIIGESSGSMILWEYFLNDQKSWFIKGLGLIKNTIIIPHYSTDRRQQEKLQQLLSEKQTETWYQLLWIDETTFIEYEDWKFGEIIWTGKVYYL